MTPKANQWEESLQLLRLYGSPQLPIGAVNSLLAACGRGGRADMAMEILYELEQYGLNADERSYQSTIIACNQAEHEFRRSHCRTQETDDEDCRLERDFAWWECAISLLQRMQESGLQPNTLTLSSSISACEAAGEWQVALGILQSAMGEEVRKAEDTSSHGLNLYCFNAAIAACEKGGAWVEALEIYERMKGEGGQELQPNIVTLSSLVLALDNAGQEELAVSIYDEGIRRKYIRSPWRLRTKQVSTLQDKIAALDLHSFSVPMAKAAVRSHVESLLEKGKPPEGDWTIIVGKGLRSGAAGPVLKHAVQELLTTAYGITGLRLDNHNAGRLVVPQQDLAKFVKRRSWR